MRYFNAVILLMMVVFLTAANDEISPRDLPVESFVLVETADINARIVAAVESGDDWPFDPVSVAFEFLGSMEYRYVNIEKNDDIESPNNTIVTIIRGGLLDDSVWGTWDQLQLSRTPKGIWHVDEARRAWRCYRGHQKDSFGKRLCL